MWFQRRHATGGIVRTLIYLKSYTPQCLDTFLSWLWVVIILATPFSPHFAFWGGDQTAQIRVTGSCNEVPPQAGKLLSQWQDEELSYERSQLMYFRSVLKSPPEASPQRLTSFNQLGKNPKGNPGHAGSTTSFYWPKCTFDCSGCAGGSLRKSVCERINVLYT